MDIDTLIVHMSMVMRMKLVKHLLKSFMREKLNVKMSILRLNSGEYF